MILANLQVIWGLCLVTPDLELSASREFTYRRSDRSECLLGTAAVQSIRFGPREIALRR